MLYVQVILNVPTLSTKRLQLTSDKRLRQSILEVSKLKYQAENNHRGREIGSADKL